MDIWRQWNCNKREQNKQTNKQNSMECVPDKNYYADAFVTMAIIRDNVNNNCRILSLKSNSMNWKNRECNSFWQKFTIIIEINLSLN